MGGLQVFSGETSGDKGHLPVERYVDAAGALLGRICSDLALPGLSETAIDPYSKIMIPTSDS